MFSVVVLGKQENADFATVKENASKLFKVPLEKAEALISPQSPVVVKRGIDEVTAKKYVSAIQAAGLDCSLVKQDEAPATLPTTATKTQKTDAELGTVCRQCSTKIEQANALFCPACGTPINGKAPPQGMSNSEQAASPQATAPLTHTASIPHEEELTTEVKNQTRKPKRAIGKILLIGLPAILLGLLGAIHPAIGIVGVLLSLGLLFVVAKNAVSAMKVEHDLSENARIITDVYEALEATGLLFFVLALLGAVIGSAVSLPFAGISLALVCASKYLGHFFAARYVGIVIDEEQNLLSLPGSELDNSIWDMLTLKAERNQAKRDSLELTAVEGVFCQSRRYSVKKKDSEGRSKTVQKVKYGLNITGTFGSRNLEFSSKQKRDEARSAILTCTKNVKEAPNTDMPVDIG